MWLAEYCGALVAVKILAKVKSDFMTQSMQQQLALRNLKKEALLMSKLRHPNGEARGCLQAAAPGMHRGLLRLLHRAGTRCACMAAPRPPPWPHRPTSLLLQSACTLER